MHDLINGRYRARIGQTKDDLRAAQRLRHQAFFGGEGLDQDRFDDICTHMLIEECQTGQLVCCFRILPLPSGAEIDRSYAAQFYDLSALQRFPGKMVEMGRFCVLPGLNDPDILRIAWGAMTRYVDENTVEILFGCSSFPGTDAGQYLDAFGLLKKRHVAPIHWAPRVKAASIFRFAETWHKPDMRKALTKMPPLLRSYLSMGGWVSDHAVVDRQLNTLHVFTGLEIRAIPAARKRRLRAVAQ
ncbi:GNAT family N-acyltransferase [uncultured Roseovarius sp.]|uniref:GNAT family N-acetyltransferase n=1 Tax=uncultured Roseovarius sp. TaxID=293344 RepID=UPI0026138A2E|nr:GNAT family N-acyltransferase [uncultured Roseovarius sp.]